MKNFMQYDFDIQKIDVAFYAKNEFRHVHNENRPSHGLAFKFNDYTVEYAFSCGKVLKPSRSDIIYLPKGSDYSITNSHSDGPCYVINFELASEANFEPFSVHTKDSNGFLNDFKSADRSWTKRNYGYHLECKALLYSILYKLQKENQTTYTDKAKHEIIKPALTYIHEHYATEGLNIIALSEMCDITPEYFRKIFHNIYGVSPIKYINRLKLSRAEEMLLSGMCSVTEAALSSGYNDMSYFSREFKKAHGIAPSEFAKSTRK